MNKVIYHGIACVVVNKEGKVLILKRSPDKKIYPNKWFVVGAYPLKGDEDMKKFAEDELLDELGNTGNIVKEGENYISTLKKEKVIVHTFLANLNSYEIKLNHEHTEYKWVSVSDLKNYDLAPGTATIVTGLVEK